MQLLQRFRRKWIGNKYSNLSVQSLCFQDRFLYSQPLDECLQHVVRSWLLQDISAKGIIQGVFFILKASWNKQLHRSVVVCASIRIYDALPFPPLGLILIGYVIFQSYKLGSPTTASPLLWGCCGIQTNYIRKNLLASDNSHINCGPPQPHPLCCGDVVEFKLTILGKTFWRQIRAIEKEASKGVWIWLCIWTMYFEFWFFYWLKLSKLGNTCM